MPAARSLAEATGAETYVAAIGIAGPTQATSDFVTLPTVLTGGKRCYHLPSGTTTFTLPMRLSGVLQANSPSDTELLIPTFATLGWTRDSTDTVELAIPVQRVGAGLLSVNGATGVTITDPNDLDPVNLGQLHPIVWVVTDGNDSWHYE